MRIAVYSARSYDRQFLTAANERHGHELEFLEARLDGNTAKLAEGFDAVCPFVNDRVDAEAIRGLAERGVELLTLRSAGYNHVDLEAAVANHLTVARVPAYSPYAVAEHTVALMLAVQRRLHRAYNRVRDGNFALDGLLGFDLRNKRVGIVGTGKIGQIVARILRGFGCSMRAYDPCARTTRSATTGCATSTSTRCSPSATSSRSTCPLTPETHHLIDAEALAKMKPA
jgi:D-lactate dehydrogenase